MRSSYPPISDYAYIGDCHSSALISRSCSIDWCCMPRMDSSSCFGRLLDWEKGGYCQVVPKDKVESSRRYLPGSLILETTFTSSEGKARITDCFTMREGGEYHPHRQILRMIDCIEGNMRLVLEILPRFDFGEVRPWIKPYGDGCFIAPGGSNGLLISGDIPIELSRKHELKGAFYVQKDSRYRLSILFRDPAELDEGNVDVPDIEEFDRRLDDTITWWKKWSSRTSVSGEHKAAAMRSAIVLKGLTNAPTGSMAAAPTTSLPEAMGGNRNWDCRFSWIRDSAFAVRSPAQVGHDREADGFRRFVERTAAGSADELQVVLGIGWERRFHEIEIKGMEGYRGSAPVRIGNAAESQIQLDIYGEILDLAWTWFKLGHAPDEDYWKLIVDVLNATASNWQKTDQGIWEIRGKPRHFVKSKAMCWSALDRGIRLAKELGRKAPVGEWKKVRDEIRIMIEKKGYDQDLGVFIQAFGFTFPDSALLLLPLEGFVEYDAARMIRTTEWIAEELDEKGFIRRYKNHDYGMEGKEGAFLACSFWMAECLARQGRIDEAHRVFRKTLSAGNDLLLFSEEYDPHRGEMLGNFPQGLSHLSLIAAVVALNGTDSRINVK
jgi:GH15 family glucan-1,4-alpha-glucosidase